MLEIFRLQLGQILGGKKKWLVAVCLLLPVLLTWTTMNVGGLGDLKREIEQQAASKAGRHGNDAGDAPAAPRPPSRTAHRVDYPGKPVKLLDGRFLLLEDLVLYDGKPVRPGTRIVVDDGYLVVENGVVWLDEARRRPGPDRTISIHHGHHDIEVSWEVVSAIYLFLLYPQTICLLLALFYGSSLLGSELDGKTLTYLFTRPLARWRLVTGKYLAIVAALIPATAASLTVSWWLMGAPDTTGLLPALLLAAAGGILAYNSIFAMLGFLVPRRAMILALIYGVVFEMILSFVPALVNQITVTYYLRSMVVEIVQLEIPREAARVVGGASLPMSLLALAGMVGFGLLVSSLLASRREYVVADQA